MAKTTFFNNKETKKIVITALTRSLVFNDIVKQFWIIKLRKLPQSK